MQVSSTPGFVPTYRPPGRTTQLVMHPEHRAVLRELVTEALTGLEAVATTHHSAADTLRHLRTGWTIDESYRPQLVAAGSVGAGEDLRGTVFASLQLRPRSSTQPVLGIERYGDVAVHWRPSALAGASISPEVTRSVGNVAQTWRGMQAGSMDDLADVALDGLANAHGINSVFREGGLFGFLDMPRADAVRGVAGLLVQRQRGEAILRGVTATHDAIEAITFLRDAAPSPELDAIRAWADEAGVRVIDQRA